MRLFHQPIAPHLSPNASHRDIWFACRWLLNPFVWLWWYALSPLQSLHQWFRQQFHTSFVYSFDSGRTALAAVLEAAQLPKGSVVAIQAFTCVAVPNAVRAVGLHPIYLDIDASLNMEVSELERVIVTYGARLRAVIVQHTFGVPADIQRIATLCRTHQVVLIEDCAHALGAAVDGQLVGTFGDASIFSFGRDKVISTVSGGVAITSRSDIGQQLHRLWKGRRYPSPWWIGQRLLHPIAFAFALPLYRIKIGVVCIAALRFFHILPVVLSQRERCGTQPEGYRFPGVLARWALLQLHRLGQCNDRRREISAIYTQLLQPYISRIGLQLSTTVMLPVFLRFVVLVDQPEAMKRFFHDRGILLGDWYDTPIAPRSVDSSTVEYIPGSCPVAERVAVRVVNLPTQPTMNARERQFVQTAVQEYFSTTYGH